MSVNALPPVQPGVYLGPGLASLLRANGQQYLWLNQNLVAGTTASIAIQLERLRAGLFYPWGAAFEVAFSGAPGTFEIDIQFAETDKDANYVTVGTITAVNATNVGRYDMPNTVFPRYVRGFAKTFPNAVTATLLLTH
jgi:hypothetical protein